MRKASPPELHGIEPVNDEGRKRILLGVVFAITATLIFACQDAITKTLVGEWNYPATFILMVRYWFFLLAGIYMVRSAEGGMKTNVKSKRPVIQCLRGVLLLLELYAVAQGLKYLGLAGVTSLFQSYPLFGTVFAVFLLKEQVGWRRVLALFIGFIGILIMLRPGSSVLSLGALWALAASILFALYMAFTRLVGPVDKPQTSFFYVGLVGMVLTSACFPLFWVPMDKNHIWLLAVLCASSIAGHFSMIKALSLAPLTVVQPFNYLQLVWSVILGYLIFHEKLDIFTFIGAALVVGSGLFVFYREQMRSPRINKK